MTRDHLCVLVGLAFVVIIAALLIFRPRREPREAVPPVWQVTVSERAGLECQLVLELATLLRPDVEAAPQFSGEVDVVSFLGAVEVLASALPPEAAYLQWRARLLDELRPQPSRLAAVERSVAATPAPPRWGNDRPVYRQVW